MQQEEDVDEPSMLPKNDPPMHDRHADADYGAVQEHEVAKTTDNIYDAMQEERDDAETTRTTTRTTTNSVQWKEYTPVVEDDRVRENNSDTTRTRHPRGHNMQTDRNGRHNNDVGRNSGNNGGKADKMTSSSTTTGRFQQGGGKANKVTMQQQVGGREMGGKARKL